MACSRTAGVLNAFGPWPPARTCGPLGCNDQSDPSLCTRLGDTPGPLGLQDLADPTLPWLLPSDRLSGGNLFRASDGTALSLTVLVALARKGRAPWMAFAEEQARLFKGAEEKEIEKTHNFQTEVGTGQKTIIGGDHPWCAAFVNWCLLQAGYVVENRDYADHVAAKGRAHAFYEVHRDKVKKGGKSAPLVRNPLYVTIDKPVFGAIAMVTASSGHGHHVGFVYSKPRDNFVVLLGGNQSDRVKFSEFNIEPVKSITVIRDGKKTTLKGHTDRLMFFIPTAYQAFVDSDTTALAIDSADDLNKSFGVITGKSGQKESTR